eukprot:gnl/TRDRNA2_/TRDRNA2_153678_c0_seq1.p1 gnl/TRDRNA2_/TRDRNA2_153678_c0~~gnl/TRDRNA2_/TRDRNA2_153678_c0_seq1.p1  ORF type:complete len:220 (+),score=31.01 gnl/TRDRNA2_/TRDRNA2_153678_c0_seq1:74-733(+)
MIAAGIMAPVITGTIAIFLDRRQVPHELCEALSKIREGYDNIIDAVARGYSAVQTQPMIDAVCALAELYLEARQGMQEHKTNVINTQRFLAHRNTLSVAAVSWAMGAYASRLHNMQRAVTQENISLQCSPPRGTEGTGQRPNLESLESAMVTIQTQLLNELANGADAELIGQVVRAFPQDVGVQVAGCSAVASICRNAGTLGEDQRRRRSRGEVPKPLD